MTLENFLLCLVGIYYLYCIGFVVAVPRRETVHIIWLIFLLLTSVITVPVFLGMVRSEK